MAMIIGLSAVALMAAQAEDHGAASAAGQSMTMAVAPPGSRMTTSSTALSASPHIHATENGRCAVSSPEC